MNKQRVITYLTLIIALCFFYQYSFAQEDADDLQNKLNYREKQNKKNQKTNEENKAGTENIDTGQASDSMNWTESFSLAFGIEMAYGNSRSTVGTYEMRFSTAYKELWDFNFSLEGSYGESFDQSSGETKKDRSEHHFSAIFDRWFLNKLIAVNYNTGLSTNEFSNIFLRWTNGLAIKIRPVNVWWLQFTFSVSPAVEYTRTYDLITRKVEWRIIYQAELNLNLDKKQSAVITSSYTFTPKFLDYYNNRLNITAGLRVKFLKHFSLSVNFSYDYVSEPPNDFTDVKKSDYRISSKIGLNL